MILKNLYETNRTRLIKNLRSRVGDLSNSVVLMKGSHPFPEHDSDTSYNMPKYEINFMYLFGVRRMEVHGLIDLSTSKAYLIVPDNKFPDCFIEKRVEGEEAAAFGIEKVLTRSELIEFLKEKELKKIFINYGIDRYTKIESNKYDDGEVLQPYHDILDNDTLYPVLNNTRTIKSEVEMEFMRDICSISSKGHEYVLQHCKPGMSEYQIAALFWVG